MLSPCAVVIPPGAKYVPADGESFRVAGLLPVAADDVKSPAASSFDKPESASSTNASSTSL